MSKSNPKNAPPELTKDWSYNRPAHLDYLIKLGKEESFADWNERNHVIGISTIQQLKKNYKFGFNKDLTVALCVDMTKNDEWFPGQSYWTDLMFKLDEDAEVTNIMSELSDIGYLVTEDAVYYNPAYNSFFITLFRSIDNNGPNLY